MVLACVLTYVHMHLVCPAQDKVSEGNQAAIDATAAQAGANPGSAIKGPLAPDGTVSVTPADAAAGAGYLGYTVRLLSRCRWDDLEKMEGWCGSAKQLGVYRHVRTQKFIEFTDTEIRNKEKKLQQAYESSLIRPNKVSLHGALFFAPLCAWADMHDMRAVHHMTEQRRNSRACVHLCVCVCVCVCIYAGAQQG